MNDMISQEEKEEYLYEEILPKLERHFGEKFANRQRQYQEGAGISPIEVIENGHGGDEGMEFVPENEEDIIETLARRTVEDIISVEPLTEGEVSAE